MRKEILQRLDEIEREEQVNIFYATESGSRAWGFPSADSDYDVRFIYVHPRDWYLSVDLEYRRDVIERPINDMLDISGWDLRKTLKLLLKGNPRLMEWLGSPIIYLEHFSIAAQMRNFMARYFSPATSFYHYCRETQGQYLDYLESPTVSIKKFFYVLRPLLAVRWIERGMGIVPTEFSLLLHNVQESPEVLEEIMQLLEFKRSGNELDHAPEITTISDFIERELTRLESVRFEDQTSKPIEAVSEANRLFRSALDEIWQ